MMADCDLTGARRRRGSRAAPARRLVLDQYLELRRLLAVGIVQADALMNGRKAPQEPLRSVVATFRDVFTQHLADEEALIFPLLVDNLPVGPRRADRLREEHERQRADIEGLSAWPEESDDLELALRFDHLARALLRDIAQEERELMIPDALADDRIVIDQLAV